MISWDDLNNLHVIRKTKSIIYQWWKIDILVIDEKNIINYTNNSQVENLFSFHNPLIKELFQKKSIQEAFFKTLSYIQKQNTKHPDGFYENWPGTGLKLFIFPIQNYSYVSGFVVAAGFTAPTEESKDLETITQSWLDAGFSKEWCSQHEEYIPSVLTKDNRYFVDLLEMMAKEIASVQQEFIEKNQKITEVSTTHNISYGNMVGKSNIMHQLYNLLDKIKHSHNTILIQGENGTGKELIAKSIHQNSPRKNQPFIAQNCSALNDNLLESELFGHVKGSFTGAYKDKKGLFETADKGTFFLDEVGDTSPAMQVKILRVLQEGTFFPVGGTEPKKVDVRIIAATNKNLKKMVEEGAFREDLYYRLNVINIQVPALRERTEDISLLAEYFLNQFSPQTKVFTKKALEKLNQYVWPGNVRELRNEMERLVVFTGNDTYIKEEFLSEKIRNKENYSEFTSFLNPSNSGKAMKKAIAHLERQMISQCLKQEGWNKTKVAKKLGISRAALVAKVKDYKLEKRGLKSDPTFKKKATSS